MPYQSRFSRRRNVQAPQPRQYDPLVVTDMRGLDLSSPYDAIQKNRTPNAKNFRIYAEEADDRRVSISSRKGSGFYTTPLTEATIDTEVSTTGASDAAIGILTEWKADKFTASATGPLTKVELRIKNPGTSSGPVIVEVWTDDSGVPGVKIAESGILSSAITTSYAYVAARFIEAPTVTNAANYWVIARMQDDGSGTYQISSTTNATTALTSNNSGNTWAATTYALNIKAYGSATTTIKGLTRFAPSDNQNTTIVAIGNNIYSVNDGTGATTSRIASLNSSASDVFFTYADDKAFLVNGFDTLRTLNSSMTAATITHTNLPVLRLATFHKNRLFGVDAGDPNKIVYSEDPGNDDGAGNLWYNAWLSTSFIYVPTPKASDPITAIIPFQDNLIIFTRTSKYVLYGSNPGDFTVRQSTGKKGAVHQNAVFADENFIYFVAPDKTINRFNGSSDDIISDLTERGGGSIQPEMENVADIDKIVITKWKRIVRFYYASSGSSVNNQCLLWHTVFEEWMKDTDTQVSRAVAWTDGNDDNRLVEASSTAPVLYYAEQDDNNLGKAIDFEYNCNYNSMGNPAQRKRIVKFFPLLEGEGTNYSVTVGMDHDRQNTPRETELPLTVAGALIGHFDIGDGTTIGRVNQFEPTRIRVSGYGYYWQPRISRKAINNPIQFIGYVVSIRSKRL